MNPELIEKLADAIKFAGGGLSVAYVLKLVFDFIKWSVNRKEMKEVGKQLSTELNGAKTLKHGDETVLSTLITLLFKMSNSLEHIASGVDRHDAILNEIKESEQKSYNKLAGIKEAGEKSHQLLNKIIEKLLFAIGRQLTKEDLQHQSKLNS